MATLLELYDIVQPGSDMYKRISSAFVIAAWVVKNEGEATPNHANRLSLAEGIITNPDVLSTKHFRHVMADSTLQAKGDTAIDSEVQSAANVVLLDMIPSE